MGYCNMNMEIIQELFERILGKDTEIFKELLMLRVIAQKQLVNLIKLNAAMNKLNYISGVSPTITQDDIEKELQIHDAYIKELGERLKSPALEYNGEKRKSEE